MDSSSIPLIKTYIYPDNEDLTNVAIPPIPENMDLKMKVNILRYYLDNFFQEDEPLIWFTERPLKKKELSSRLRDFVVEWNVKLEMINEMRLNKRYHFDTYAQLKLQKSIRDTYILNIDVVILCESFGETTIEVSREEIDTVLQLFIECGRVYDVEGDDIILTKGV